MTVAGSASTMREFFHVASFSVEENTIFSTELSHFEKAVARVSRLVVGDSWPETSETYVVLSNLCQTDVP